MNDLRAVVYESGARWVVDCPNGCGNAWAPTPGDRQMQCYLSPQDLPGGGKTRSIGCRAVFALDWPADTANVLAGRQAQHMRDAELQRAYLAEAEREAAAMAEPDVPEGSDVDAPKHAHIARMRKAEARKAEADAQ